MTNDQTPRGHHILLALGGTLLLAALATPAQAAAGKQVMWAHPSQFGGWTTLAWEAPASGTVIPDITVELSPSCPGTDGVRFQLRDDGGSVLWSGTGIYGGARQIYTTPVDILAGERLFLALDKNGNNFCDHILLTFSVELDGAAYDAGTDFRASSGGVASAWTQGSEGWYFLYDSGSGSYDPLSYGTDHWGGLNWRHASRKEAVIRYDSTDSDGDGYDDRFDSAPFDPLENGYTMVDSDGDGVPDSSDACEGDDGAGDTDLDGTCDDVDADIDGDGYANGEDCDPANAAYTVDHDADLLCDEDPADTCSGTPDIDTDTDGICDSSDICPTSPTNDDLDGDSICDSSAADLCMGTSNIDADSDQVCDELDQCAGRDASGDFDEDGICTEIDNCPTEANADQANGDGDTIGDACDTDNDNDGVDDSLDNCAASFNPEQDDIDGDGHGDVCDTDDDGDGVADTSDNCPFYANSSQADLDSDGYGDVCDGDDDADSVSDALDACPGTPLSAPFDEEGCSGPQRIELECGAPDDHAWYNHGRYVACVTHEAKSAWRLGLITAREKAHLVREAALSLLVTYIRRLLRWC